MSKAESDDFAGTPNLNESGEPKRVAVVDDDQFTRTLLDGILRSAGYLVAEYANGGAFLKSTESVVPDVALLDLDLGLGPSGVDVIRELAKRQLSPHIVVLTTHRSPRLAVPGEDHQLHGLPYLVKSEATSEAILAAVQGQAPRFTDVTSDVPRITRQQIDLLKALADGKTAAQIAEERQSTVRAVHMLMSRLYESLGINQDHADARTIAVQMYRSGQVESSTGRNN